MKWKEKERKNKTSPSLSNEMEREKERRKKYIVQLDLAGNSRLAWTKITRRSFGGENNYDDKEKSKRERESKEKSKGNMKQIHVSGVTPRRGRNK